MNYEEISEYGMPWSFSNTDIFNLKEIDNNTIVIQLALIKPDQVNFLHDGV